MVDGGTKQHDHGQHSDWQDDDSISDTVDGRLSAIMPRKLFQDDAAVKSGLLQVYVRMKPVPDTTDTCMLLDQKQLLKATWRNKEAVYKFSRVFQTTDGQDVVYEGTTASLVEDFLYFRQPSAVVVAYGVTSAGKTFTMQVWYSLLVADQLDLVLQGTPDKPGLVPQALNNIFQVLSNSGSDNQKVSLSVCEIYNEAIHDLLAPAHQRVKPIALRLKEDKLGTITVLGAAEVPVQSAKEALDLLRRAAKARQSAGTGVNEHSSRSHAVITVKLSSACQETLQSHEAAAKQSYLHFVDLAGCERVKRTGNSGARLRESVAINSSLMTLARCLEVLRYNQQHPADQKVIPYRESKITHLFKGVLHGNGRFVMVVNVSPASEEFNETKRVLQYAALASKVTMTSEIEHDITGVAWPSGHNLPDESAAHAAAAGDAAASASAALSAAQARIEELLDDKADLEYEIDVVERKVELLREELIKSEVEKEQIEAGIRADVQEEMQQLIEQAVAKERVNTKKAEQAAATWRQKAGDLEQLLEQQAAQLQQHKQEQEQLKELQARAEHVKQHAQDSAAAAAKQNADLIQRHQQQLGKLQQQLLAAQAEAAQRQQQAVAADQRVTAVEAAAGRESAQLRQIAAAALDLLQQSVQQQQEATSGSAEVVAHVQHAQEVLLAKQQLIEQLQHRQEQQHRPKQGLDGRVSKKQLVADPAPVVNDVATVASRQNPEPQQQQGALGAEGRHAQVSATSTGPPAAVDEQQQEQQQEYHRTARSRQSMVPDNQPAAAGKHHPLPASHHEHAAGGVRRSRRSSLVANTVVEHSEPACAATVNAEHAITSRQAAVLSNIGGAAVDGGLRRHRRSSMAPAAAATGPTRAITAELTAAGSRKRSSRRHTLNPCSISNAPGTGPAAGTSAVAEASVCEAAAAPLGVAVKRRPCKPRGLVPILEDAEAEEQQDAVQQQVEVKQHTPVLEACKVEVPPTSTMLYNSEGDAFDAAAAAAAAAASEQQAQPAAPRKRRRACDKGKQHKPLKETVIVAGGCPQQQDTRKRRKVLGALQVQQQPPQQQQQQNSSDNVPCQGVAAQAEAEAAVVQVHEHTAVACMTAADINSSHSRSANAMQVGNGSTAVPAAGGGATRTRQRKQSTAKQQGGCEHHQQQAREQQQVQQLDDMEQIGVHAVSLVVDPAAALPSSQAFVAAEVNETQHEGEVAASAPQGGERKECWQPAERILQHVTQQQLGAATGRRATYAAGKSAARHKGTARQQLPHIAGGITPVAFRTRHRGPK